MNEEYLRGVATSLVAGTATNAVIGTFARRWASSFAVMTVAGHLVGYVLDVLFAKRAFRVRPDDEKDTEIPYGDVRGRLMLLPRVLVSYATVRFFIVAVLDAVVGSVVFSELRHVAPFPPSARRDFALAVFVSSATFVTFTNSLRFRWAYAHDPNPVVTLGVTAWTSLSIMLFAAIGAFRRECGRGRVS